LLGVGVLPLEEIDAALLRQVALEELFGDVFPKSRSKASALYRGELADLVLVSGTNQILPVASRRVFCCGASLALVRAA